MNTIAIAGTIPYPRGGAPTSRVRSMAQGLADAGAHVHVIGCADAASPTASSSQRNTGGAIRTWLLACGARTGKRVSMLEQHSRFVAGALPLLWRLRRQHQVRTLIIYNQQASIAFPLTIAARSLGIRVFQ